MFESDKNRNSEPLDDSAVKFSVCRRMSVSEVVTRARAAKDQGVTAEIEEVVVEKTRDDKPDYVRVKYTDNRSHEVIGRTRVLILAD
jgi:hypothetical protein